LLYQVLPMPQIAAQHADLGLGPERTRQQSVAVQLLQPLAIAHIRLAPRDILDLPRIDQQHLQAAALQNLKRRNPVNPGRFHDHGFHPTTGEPVRQAMKIIGKSPERLDGILVTVRADGRDMHGGTNINRRRGGVNPRQFPRLTGSFRPKHT